VFRTEIQVYQMKNITVIFTVHKDNGAANAQALLEVLERLNPEVVFLEFPEKEIESYTSLSGLENRAIAMHLEKAHPKLVPIDNITPKPDDLHLYNTLFDFLDANSSNVSINMQMEVAGLIRSNGLEYLNSNKYIMAQSELEDHEAKIVSMLGDSEIKRIYRKWRSVNSEREQGMIDNIFSYCEDCETINAVFLVGAAHRRALEERIAERFYSMADIEWVIGY
jgi:hypothetical protein